MSARLFAVFAVLAALACPLAGVARAQGTDAEAELAGAKFLVEQKGLASGKAPAEQWYGIYAGPYWTSAARIAVVEKDDAQGGMRRIDIDKLSTREVQNPTREHEQWWIDSSGAVVRGERRVFEEHADEPSQHAVYELKNGKIKLTLTTREDGETKTEKPEESDLPPGFVPDHVLPVLLIPSEKGKSWKFTTFGGDDYLPFTVVDLGTEKVRGRKGDVDARKVAVRDKEGEVAYWLDADKRIVAVAWKSYTNLYAVAGTEEESRTDWIGRPADEADAGGDRLVAGPASLEKLAGDLTYGIYDKNGKSRQTVAVTLKKDDKGGNFHFVSTTAEVGTSSVIVEEWWLAPDGTPLSATNVRSGENKTTTVKIDAKRFVLHASDAEADAKDASFPVAPRFTPETMLVLRALAKEEKGTFRFSSIDVSGEIPFSIWFEVKGPDTIRMRSGEVKARHIYLAQATAEADCWLDEQGNPLLIKWSDGELYVVGSLEDSKKDLPGPLGPPGAKTEPKKDDD